MDPQVSGSGGAPLCSVARAGAGRTQKLNKSCHIRRACVKSSMPLALRHGASLHVGDRTGLVAPSLVCAWHTEYSKHPSRKHDVTHVLLVLVVSGALRGRACARGATLQAASATRPSKSGLWDSGGRGLAACCTTVECKSVLQMV